MDINLKMILDVTKIMEMSQQNKNLIIKRIKIINKLFDKYQSIRKEMINVKSKNLVNNQIYSETKRRIVETNKLYKDKINDFDSIINKKLIYLKKTQKKFNEIQIYIRRESQNFYGFRKIFSNFMIKPFIIENENLIRYRKILNEDIENKKNIINILKDEIIEIKTNNKNKLLNINKDKDNNNINKINCKDIKKDLIDNKLNNYLLSRKEEIKFYESLNLFLINKKLVYERTIILSRNNFLKDIDMNKNEININTEFSHEISNENDISYIKKTNNNEIMELNVSNSIMDLFTIQSNV